MANELERYNDILFIDLRPWLHSKEPDIKFKQLLSNVEKEYYTYRPNYELDFIKPLSNFRKYYKAVIDREAVIFLNDLRANVTASETIEEKKYHVHTALSGTLSRTFRDLVQILAERNYSPGQFDLNLGNNPKNRSLADESFVIHYLKHELVRLCLEIQESYPDYLKEEPLSEEEVYSKYYNEPAPQPSWIIPAGNYPGIPSPLATKIMEQKKEDTPAFKALRSDFRPGKKGIYSYEQLIKNPSRFVQFEEELFRHELIDQNYQFQNKHGQKQYLAACYHQLIRKGYFRNRIIPGNKQVKPLFIRKFLDHRYNTNVDKQFRNWDGQQDELWKYVERNYWLDQILSC
jgi:hypothetical protein